MRSAISAFLVLVSSFSFAQYDSLLSNVYSWSRLSADKTATGERRQILEGSTAHLSYLEIHATTVAPGKAPHASHEHEEEEMITIKQGSLRITVNDSSKIIGPGSIAVFMPGDKHGFENTGTTDAIYYVVKYKSRAGAETERSAVSGGTFIAEAEQIVYKEGPKGGKKQYFERPTSMLKRLEAHVTTLNEGLQSHEPHTHFAEEMMIVISGEVEIQIGEKKYKMMAGDLVFLASGILHAPKNSGRGPCAYFAIQLQ